MEQILHIKVWHLQRHWKYLQGQTTTKTQQTLTDLKTGVFKISTYDYNSA